MLLTTGQGGNMTTIWEFCDPLVTEPGIITRECSVPAQDILIGYGSVANTMGELDAGWPSTTWKLFLDDQPVNLSAFSTIDQADESGIFRLWNVPLEQPEPGVHTLRYVCTESGNRWDITWILTVASTVSMEIPSGARSLPFTGTSEAFNSLAEFDSLVSSAISVGQVDPFWQAVVATGQMPLIFGDNFAVFLYRGQADKVAFRGDFMAEYLRQGETDLWGFIKQLEPDARLEYQILLNSSQPVLDSLNPLTETGGLGTNSVVQMPEYVIPEFSFPHVDIPHGTLNGNITTTSRSLDYNVNYRVYTPAGYERLGRLPVIYVTDGQDFANPGMGAMINALDNLIADGRIKPIIAVFIDPRDPTSGNNRREEELGAGSLAACPFCDFMALELVPSIDSTYKTDPGPDARALLGFSLGGMFTAHLGLGYPEVFHKIAILSPYIWADWIFDKYQEADQLPVKIFLSHGTYDERAASIRLHDILVAKDYPMLYIENHAGHSYGNNRGLLDEMLIYFFGAK